MEKFSKWRDAGTGIQPFLPVKPQGTDKSGLQTVADVLKTYVIGPPLAVIKLLFVGVVTVWFLLMSAVSVVLTPLPVVQRGFSVYVALVAGRIVLFLLGFYFIDSSETSMKKGRSRSQKKSLFPGSSIVSGDIIVANHTSYVDVIYLMFRFRPTFTRTCYLSGRIEPISFWDALKQVASPPHAFSQSAPSAAVGLIELSQRAAKNLEGPIVIFPESTASNGNGLLKFSPVFKGIEPSSLAIHIVSLKYQFESFSPSFPAGNPVIHLFQLASQFVNRLSVKYLADDEGPTAANIASAALPQMEDRIGEYCSLQLSQMLRVRRTNLDAAEKIKFLDYYEKIMHKYNKKSD